MFRKTDKSGDGRNDHDEVNPDITHGSHGGSLLCKELHMKRWFFGFILILMLALAKAVFSFGPECGMGGPPLGEPGFMGPRGPGFAGSCPCNARPEGPGMFHGRPGAYPSDGLGPFAGLKLSKEQLEKLSGMVDRSFQETRGLRYDLSLKCLEMHKLFSDPRVDETTLIAKQKELSLLRQKLMERMDQMIIEGRGTLAPEQIQKLDRMPGPPGMGH
jgi:Spy/CpxP family protein refolding chaperone